MAVTELAKAPATGINPSEKLAIKRAPQPYQMIFWTWRPAEIVDRLRDLGYPCKPHTGPGSLQ